MCPRGYFKCVSLRFILHGLFLMLAISFFFSSTSSISRAISPSDMDSSSSSELDLESEELDRKWPVETEKEDDAVTEATTFTEIKLPLVHTSIRILFIHLMFYMINDNTLIDI